MERFVEPGKPFIDRHAFTSVYDLGAHIHGPRLNRIRFSENKRMGGKRTEVRSRKSEVGGIRHLKSAFQICISAVPAALDRYPRGFAGHFVHPVRSIQLSNLSVSALNLPMLAGDREREISPRESLPLPRSN